MLLNKKLDSQHATPAKPPRTEVSRGRTVGEPAVFDSNGLLRAPPFTKLYEVNQVDKMDLAFPPPPPAPPLTAAQERGRLLLKRGSGAYGVGVFLALDHARETGAFSYTVAMFLGLLLLAGPVLAFRGSEFAKHLTGVIGLFAAMIGLYMGVLLFFPGTRYDGALAIIVGILGCYTVKAYLINQDVKDFFPTIVASRREIQVNLEAGPPPPDVVVDFGPILLRKATWAYLALAPSMVFDFATGPRFDVFSGFLVLAILGAPYWIWRGSLVWARFAGFAAACATMAAFAHAMSVEGLQRWLSLLQFGLDLFFMPYVMQKFWWNPVVHQYLEVLRNQTLTNAQKRRLDKTRGSGPTTTDATNITREPTQGFMSEP